MNKTMKYLMDEHVYILKVADRAEGVCNELSDGADLDKEFVRGFIDFIRNYADKFHHAKEEAMLFVEMQKPGVELPCNPVEQMLIEHDDGRELIAGIEEGLNSEDVEKVVSNMKEYVGLIRDHIWKEDNVLYRMADESLNKEVLDKMFVDFEKVDSGKDVNKYIEFALK
jgi:hemerythrin-like domain-containing protein